MLLGKAVSQLNRIPMGSITALSGLRALQFSCHPCHLNFYPRWALHRCNKNKET